MWSLCHLQSISIKLTLGSAANDQNKKIQRPKKSNCGFFLSHIKRSLGTVQCCQALQVVRDPGSVNVPALLSSATASALQLAGRRWGGGGGISLFPLRTFSRRCRPLLFISPWPALSFISRKKREDIEHFDEQSLPHKAKFQLPLGMRKKWQWEERMVQFNGEWAEERQGSGWQRRMCAGGKTSPVEIRFCRILHSCWCLTPGLL